MEEIAYKFARSRSFEPDEEIRNRDKKKKFMICELVNKSRVSRNDINKGDLVLMKQDRTSKLSSNFGNVPGRVVNKSGSQVTVQMPGGAKYKRNLSHVKKYMQPEEQGIHTQTPNRMESRGQLQGCGEIFCHTGQGQRPNWERTEGVQERVGQTTEPSEVTNEPTAPASSRKNDQEEKNRNKIPEEPGTSGTGSSRQPKR